MSSRTQLTKTKILEAARRLLLQRGFHGAAMAEIAREAGVSRQAVYLHFRSKPELLVAVAEFADQEAGVPEILSRLSQAKTPDEIVNSGVTAYAEIQPRIYDIATVVYAARRSDPAAETAWQNRMAFRLAGIKFDMERLQGMGALAEGWTADAAAEFTWALLSLHTYEYLVIERSWSIERFVEHLQETLRRTLLDRAP